MKIIYKESDVSIMEAGDTLFSLPINLQPTKVSLPNTQVFWGIPHICTSKSGCTGTHRGGGTKGDSRDGTCDGGPLAVIPEPTALENTVAAGDRQSDTHNSSLPASASPVATRNWAAAAVGPAICLSN